MDHELAPAALFRAATWSMDALEQLQDEWGCSADAADATDADELVHRYDAAIERQRARLHAMTTADPRFRCAVAISSPRLAEAMRRSADPGVRRTKRVRHLETSLLRYLARACGRVEPAGQWASVGLARFGDAWETTSTPRPHRVVVAPELHPFRATFEAMQAREPYAARAPARIHPTFARRGDGWVVARRTLAGDVSWIELPVSPAWELLAERTGAPAIPRAALEAWVAETVGYDGARELVELARAAGVVVTGVGFPGRHADADDALRRAEARLDGVDRARWSACRRRIATDCEQLARALERTLDRDEQGADADAVLATNASVRAAVHALIAESGATDVKIPDSMLRVDLVAAFDIWIGRRDAVELLSVLADWARTERRGGGLQRHPRRVRRLLGRLAGVDLFARDHEPEIEDEKDATEGGASVAPPLGALVIRPTPSGTAWVRGVSDAPTATHARHAAALAERGDPLLPWFRARFDRLAADAGLEIVDLVADAPVSPNVCSRPEYVARCVRPWSVDDAGLGARARLVRGPHRGALLIDDAGRHRVAFAFTAATAPTRDPIVARLLATSFSPLADGPPSAVRDVAPSSATRDVARRTTDDGRVVVPARTMLSTTQCRGLATVRGAARFVMWRRLVRTHRWGAIVRVSRAHGEPMLVPTGSPLAIEALFEGFRGEPLVVHEVIDRGWSVDAAGARCVELVVPFARPGNPWRAVDADGGRCDEAAG